MRQGLLALAAATRIQRGAERRKPVSDAARSAGPTKAARRQRQCKTRKDSGEGREGGGEGMEKTKAT